MNSGNADVVPWVASEKNVDACVVSSESDQVYDPCTDQPLANRRRASTMNAVYQELPSEDFASIVVHAVFRLGAPAGKNGCPSAPIVGTAVFRSPLRSRCTPRDPA